MKLMKDDKPPKTGDDTKQNPPNRGREKFFTLRRGARREISVFSAPLRAKQTYLKKD